MVTMRWSRRSSVVVFLLFAFAALLAPPLLAAGMPPSATPLFVAASVPERGGLVEHRGAETVRSRIVTLGGEVSEETMLLTLNLFDDIEVTALRESVETLGPGKFNWAGRILGIERGAVILSVDGNALAGNITFPSGFYQVRTVGPNLYGIYQIDQNKFPQESEPRQVSLPPQPAQGRPGESAGDDGSIIDVLVVYTQTAASGSANIGSEIQLAIAETNQSYQNSGISQRVRLAHSAQISYSETGNFCGSGANDLDRLRDGSDGYLDDVPPMRDQYCADEVVLLVENGDACGCAFYMSSPSSSFEGSAFAVVMRSCATGYYSFGHEMGHNMGAAHDWYVTSGDPSSSYNHGYVDAAHQWRTVMAYNNQCTDAGSNCTRLQYWSNPALTYNGAPLGVSQGSYHAADNHATLNSTAYTVANFRTSCSGPGCTLDCAASAPSSAQPGTSISFSATATPSGCSGSASFLWSFGDGGTSNSQNATHTYSSAGTYSWSMTASVSGTNCTRSGSIVVGSSGHTVYLNWSPPASGGVNPPTNLQATPQAQRVESSINEAEPNGCITLVGGSSGYQTVRTGDTIYGSVEPTDSAGCIHFTDSSDYWEDLYAFTVSASATYTLTLSWSGGQDLDLLLFTTGMAILNPACGSTYCGYTCSNPESFSTSLSPGTYVLAVNLASGDGACSSPSTVSYTVTISGGPSTGPTLLGYDIYRATTDSDPSYSKINSGIVAASATAYTDSTAPEGILYYRAKALYDQGASGWSNTATANTNPVTPPTVSWMAKRGNPFRIECSGSNLQPGIKVYISGSLWSNVSWGSSNSIKLKGGSALKAMVPKGVTTLFRFVNPDGGERSYTWHWP